MTALEKGLQWERALDLFDEMKSKKLPITVVSYGALCIPHAFSAHRAALTSLRQTQDRLSQLARKVFSIDSAWNTSTR